MRELILSGGPWDAVERVAAKTTLFHELAFVRLFDEMCRILDEDNKSPAWASSA